MQKAFRAVITGRVQMVMYRDFATRAAHAGGIVGSVRNLEDGSVEVIAEGEEEALKDYIEKLQKGPMLAHVEKVDVQWQVPTSSYAGFTIEYRVKPKVQE